MRDKEANSIDGDTVDAAPATMQLPAGGGSDISLMALDAASAAACPRPAGRSFAAAAGEIKGLAAQTAQVASEAAAGHSDLAKGRAAG